MAASRPKQISMCRSCGEPIVFVRTASGRWMPVNAASVTPGDTAYDPQRGHENHWQHCAQADYWRTDAKGG